jgi:hypothetical protein
LDKNYLDLEKQGENINLPLTEIKAFEDSPLSPGFWFYLRGEYKQGDNQITYAQIVHYNPKIRNLQEVLYWKNPNGQLPKWQQVTGSDAKELVIEQQI